MDLKHNILLFFKELCILVCLTNTCPFARDCMNHDLWRNVEYFHIGVSYICDVCQNENKNTIRIHVIIMNIIITVSWIVIKNTIFTTRYNVIHLVWPHAAVRSIDSRDFADLTPKANGVGVLTWGKFMLYVNSSSVVQRSRWIFRSFTSEAVFPTKDPFY